MRFVFLLSLILVPCIVYAQKITSDSVDTPKIRANEAMNIVKKHLSEFKTGNAYVSQGKSGVKSINVEVILDNFVVTYIRINPQTGEILPKGFRTYYPKALISDNEAIKIVDKTLTKIEVGNPWLNVEKKWKVPLVLNNSVIAEISVDGNTGQVTGKKLVR